MFWYSISKMLVVISLIVVIFQIRKIYIMDEIDNNNIYNFLLASLLFTISRIPGHDPFETLIIIAFALANIIAIAACIRCMLKKPENDDIFFEIEEKATETEKEAPHGDKLPSTKEGGCKCEDCDDSKKPLLP